MSTGKPKTTDHLLSTVFLRHENNKISDIVNIETSDFVRASVKISYCVNFDVAMKDKWFSVENYVKYLCDKERSLIKREAKKYTIEEFWKNYSDIVRNVAIAAPAEKTDKDAKPWRGREFAENGMYVYDAEILSISVEDDIAELLNESQYDNIRQALELADIEKRAEIAKRKLEAESEEQQIRAEKDALKQKLDKERALNQLAAQAEVNRKAEAEKAAARQAELDLQEVLNTINDEKIKRDKAEEDMKAAVEAKKIELEQARQEAYAKAIVDVLSAIQPGLIESMNSQSNAELMRSVAEGFAPYAIARHESVSEVVDRMIRGTTLEGVLEKAKTALEKK